MNLKLFIVTAVIGIAFNIYLFTRTLSPPILPEGTIGIIQTASHPALDRVRKEFISQLKILIPGIQFIEQNAEGIASQAQSIATSFHANKRVTAIAAIGTMAFQAAASVEKEKPLFIAAITDPAAIGLGENVSGTSDKIPVSKQFELIATLTPQVKRVALLFTVGEINSTAAVAEMKKIAEEQHIETISIGIQNASDIVSAVTSACNKADALLLPNDNVLSPAIGLIARLAREKNKPLYVSDPSLVEQGALACVGIDYAQAGKDTALVAYKVLKERKNPSSIPIVYEENPAIFMNKNTVDKLGLAIPSTISIVWVNNND